MNIRTALPKGGEENFFLNQILIAIFLRGSSLNAPSRVRRDETHPSACGHLPSPWFSLAHHKVFRAKRRRKNVMGNLAGIVRSGRKSEKRWPFYFQTECAGCANSPIWLCIAQQYANLTGDFFEPHPDSIHNYLKLNVMRMVCTGPISEKMSDLTN